MLHTYVDLTIFIFLAIISDRGIFLNPVLPVGFIQSVKKCHFLFLPAMEAKTPQGNTPGMKK